MGDYQDVHIVLDAYHQLERGRRVSRIEAAAKRLRSVDPANELLPELESKIAAMGTAHGLNASFTPAA